jgi:bifunctional N-acetylglucosamine-1-phosphate-uridyltransferase/glucosamine-1-phosphate-acetyltransferase GlmU-like protein
MRFNGNLPNKLMDKVKKEATEREIYMTDVIREALELYFKEKEKP